MHFLRLAENVLCLLFICSLIIFFSHELFSTIITHLFLTSGCKCAVHSLHIFPQLVLFHDLLSTIIPNKIFKFRIPHHSNLQYVLACRGNYLVKIPALQRSDFERFCAAELALMLCSAVVTSSLRCPKLMATSCKLC